MSTEKVTKLRDLLVKHNIDAYLINDSDRFLNEYPPEHDKRMHWLTNFDSTHSITIVTQNKAAIFTNGIYILQAELEADQKTYELYNIRDKQAATWLSENLPTDAVIGYDPWLFTEPEIKRYQNTKPIAINLIDELWHRSISNNADIFIYETKYAGKSLQDKLQAFRQELAGNSCIITDPTLICWLLNIRGYDIDCTPLVLSYLIITDTQVQLFCNHEIPQAIQQHFSSAVQVFKLRQIVAKIKDLKNNSIIIDPKNTPIWFIQQLSSDQIIYKDNFYQIPKAIKNSVECNWFRKVHHYDGLALSQCLYNLSQYKPDGTLGEMDIFNQLLELRQTQPNFIMPSFDSIVGFAGHGAIIHYRVSEESNISLNKDGILLIDSGGQYFGGTTDVTRTMTIGDTITKQQKQHFTLVLKGHINLAMAVFPQGTTGAQLDVLARQYLWQHGLDYQHGTGHGVGCCLSVHEGPQSISPALINVPLQEGMVVSIEPGYYKKDTYGIRIESLAIVVPVQDMPGFLTFEVITQAPIDYRLIDISLLNQAEIDWFNNYHKTLIKILTDLSADKKLLRWLQQHKL